MPSKKDKRPMTKYILEGEWSGYSVAQRKIVHREVIEARYAKQFDTLKKIIYTDGTALLLSVNPVMPRERVIQKLGYQSLIKGAAYLGKAVVHVSEVD